MAVYNARMWHELRTNDLVHTFIGFVGTAVEHCLWGLLWNIICGGCCGTLFVRAAVEHYFVYTFGYFDKRKRVRNRKVFGTFRISFQAFFFLLYTYVST